MNDCVTMAVVATGLNLAIALVEFPPYKVTAGDVAYFEDEKYHIFGKVQNTVHCVRNDSTYNALVSLYGRQPIIGSASFTPFYCIGGEENGL